MPSLSKTSCCKMFEKNVDPSSRSSQSVLVLCGYLNKVKMVWFVASECGWKERLNPLDQFATFGMVCKGKREGMGRMRKMI
jgi:hypothetical protein